MDSAVGAGIGTCIDGPVGTVVGEATGGAQGQLLEVLSQINLLIRIKNEK